MDRDTFKNQAHTLWKEIFYLYLTINNIHANIPDIRHHNLTLYVFLVGPVGSF